MLVGVLAAVVALPAPAELADAWRRLQAQRPLVSVPAWTPGADDLKELAAGGIVKAQLPAEHGATDHILAAVVLDQPIDVVWVAVLDGRHGAPAADGMKDLVEHAWVSAATGVQLLYQRLDLPALVSDRHWIIDVRNNPELYAHSGGDVWERTWRLDPRGATALAELPPELRRDLDDVVWTPVNDGGWCLLRVGYTTAVIYHLRADIGGYLPPSLVTTYAKSKLDELLGQVARRADRVGHHYVASHQPLLRPDGLAVAPYGSGK